GLPQDARPHDERDRRGPEPAVLSLDGGPAAEAGDLPREGGLSARAAVGRGRVLRRAPRALPARHRPTRVTALHRRRDMMADLPAPYAVATHGESIVVARGEALDWARSALERAGTLHAYAAGCEGARVLQG